MNKTISINIAKQFFHIDENAFLQLEKYLNAIKDSLDTDSKDEVMADIESRIAELFYTKSLQNSVITQKDVEEIITIMGQPEDYILQDSTIPTAEEPAKNTIKKLYRNPEQRWLGGVCSGIGHYFNIDPIWIRILFLFLFFFYGISILIYPILWILIPKASNISQILEMKGIPVNISNIEKEIKESIGKYSTKLKKENKYNTDIIKKFIGISLIIFSIVSIISSGIIQTLFFNSPENVEPFYAYLSLYPDLPTFISINSLKIILFLLFALPFIILFIIGIRLTYKKIKHTRWIIAFLSIIWLSCVSLLGFLAVKAPLEAQKIKNKILNEYQSTTLSKIDLNLAQADTLTIHFKTDSRLYSNDSIVNNNFINSDNISVIFALATDNTQYAEIEENKLQHTNTHISINNGSYQIQTNKIPTTLPYEYNYENNTLYLSKNILSKGEKYDDDDLYEDFYPQEKVKIKVILKEGQIVQLNSEDEDFYNFDIENGLNLYQMKQGTLTPILAK